MLIPLRWNPGSQRQSRFRRGADAGDEYLAGRALGQAGAAAAGLGPGRAGRHRSRRSRKSTRGRGDPNFTQILILPRTDEPLGRRRYWPIFEAAVRNNLPITVHVGGTNGHPSTGGGWPSYYMEEHHSVAQTMQAVLTSLVFEGVFERFPKLRVVIMEGGLGWIPSLSARMDKHWSRLRSEVPHLKRPPSEYIREQCLVHARSRWKSREALPQLIDLFDRIGWDRLLFSTDYPHWDFDDPRYAFKAQSQRSAARSAPLWQFAPFLRTRMMARHIVATVDEIAPGQRRLVSVNGREIGIFNVDGEYFAVGNRCPHEGASLCKGRLVGLVEASEPGSYQYSRRGELVRCPWHGWEFDLRTGKSWCEPDRTKVRSYELKVESGGALVEGELRAETFPVSVEKQYIVVEV